MNRVYAYGCRPVSNLALVEAEMSAAHRYYNTLIEIEQARMAREAEVLPEMPRDVATGKRAKRPPLTTDQLARLGLIRAMAHDAGITARAARDCYWGTGGLVEDAVTAAVRERSARFRRWDGSGTIGVQLHGVVEVADVLAGNDTRVRLDSTHRYPLLSIRVGSDEAKAPIWATFSLKLDRPLPAARVRYVRVHRRRIGTQHKWSVQFVLDGEHLGSPVPAPELGTVGIDIGWRAIDGEIRVAVAVDAAGAVSECRIPQRLRLRAKKVEDLRSIRDKRTDAAMAELRAWRAANAATLPDWFREATETLHAWRAAGKLAALTIRWRTNRWDGDAIAFGAAEAWRKQDKHLLEWEANQRESVINCRKDLFRCWAKQIARYRTVVLERLNLRAFTDRPGQGAEPETAQARAARGVRQEAGVSILRGAIKDAVRRAGGEIVEVPAVKTTQTCSVCEREEPFDAAANLRHRCVQCLAEWDQDENAARNLLRAAKRDDAAYDRSQGTNVGDSGASKKKLGPRRNRKATRSKADTQTSGSTRQSA